MDSIVDFSIIVTVYNIEKYIAECLDSLLGQNDVSFEIICVDDYSSDESFRIVQDYSKRDKRIRLYKLDKNVGLASARNLGIRKANGRYIYNIDGDDKLANGALKVMYDYMSNNQLDVLSFSALSFFDSEELKKFGNENEYIRKNEYSGIWEGKRLFAELIKNDERASGNMVLYCIDSSFFKRNNLYLDEGLRYGDDRMFAIFMHAEKIMCINTPLYLRRYREGSMVTGKMKKIYLESLIVGLASELITWRSIEADEFVNSQIERYFDIRLREIDLFEKNFKDTQTEMHYLKQHPVEMYLYDRITRKKTIYDELLTEEDIIKIKKTKKLYVYGAGQIASNVTEVLENKGINDS